MNVIDLLIQKIRIIRDDVELDAFLRELHPDNIAKPVRIAFVNAHAVNLAHRNDAFLQDILSCDYVLRDGSGMKLLYKLLGHEPGLNMNGTDFIPRVIELYKGQSCALMGTDSPYLEQAALKISEAGLTPSVMINGFREGNVYVDALRQSPVSLVILAMGMPKQEYVARLIAEQVRPNSLILCGGAILDFMAEKVTRAPDFIRNMGMEWAYRLMLEPRRLFNRYVIGNAVFLGRAVKKAMSREKKAVSGDRPLKVLHVVRQFYPAIGGLESYVYSMVKNQQKLGYECQVLTLNKVFHGYEGELASEETIDGIPVKRVGFKGKRRYFIPMISPFYFKQFDLVHVHNTDMFYDYGALCAALTGTPFFATTHGGFFHTKDFSAIKKIYFNVVTRVTSIPYKAIFAISQNDFDTFKTITDKVIFQPNAVEPLGQEIASGSDFLYIGRLAEHKHVEKAILVFALLKQRHGASGKFHVVGPEWDVKISDLQAVAQASGVTNDVVFHGAASVSNMRSVAQGCGYFLSASAFEGFGMSMLEAMSIGLIPFVHSNESFTELVQKSGIGVHTDFNTPEAAADAIAAYLPLVGQETRAAAQRFAGQYSWGGLVANTDRIYRERA